VVKPPPPAFSSTSTDTGNNIANNRVNIYGVESHIAARIVPRYRIMSIPIGIGIAAVLIGRSLVWYHSCA
jgi:hypothetical protein